MQVANKVSNDDGVWAAARCTVDDDLAVSIRPHLLDGIEVENPPANAGDIRDMSSIPGSGRSPGEGNGNHSSTLTWEIPWTEKHGGL